MKKSIITIFTIAIASWGFAQNTAMTTKGAPAPVAATANVTVQEAMQSMSKGQHNSFTITLPDAPEKMAASVWKETMKTYKAKAKKKGKEMVATTEKMPKIAAGEVTVYASFDANEMTVWFESGGTFVSSSTHEGSFTFVEELFNDYLFDLKKAIAAKKIEDEEKTLKGLNKDLEKLEKENKSLHETIEKAKATIADAEQGIEQNLKNQEAKQEEIAGQQQNVEAAKKAHSSITRFKKKQ